jgi:hypothetical protein
VAAAAVAVLIAVGAVTILGASRGNARTYPTALFVSPTGSDGHPGTTAGEPLKTIQAALNLAGPGTTVHLARGTYHESPVTKTTGKANDPITILGSDTGFVSANRQGTVLAGTGRVFSINNSYYQLVGFTITGESGLGSALLPGKLASATPFKASVQAKVQDSKLVYIGAADNARNVHDVVLRDMFLTDAGGECVRIRNGANHNEVLDSTIQWCGLQAVKSAPSVFAYHNGEGVYIGTSPKSAGEPMRTDDSSSFNSIVGNMIRTFGSECLDVKENSHDNVFSHNTCADNTEPLTDGGSNIELRGYRNQILDNTITGSLGYGLKMASDSTRYRQGGNVVEGNHFSGDKGTAVENDQSTKQGRFCGNVFPRKLFLSGRSVGNATGSCT